MVYYIINKPYGMLSQFTSEGGHKSLKDLDFDFAKDVYPVGRLDHDSEGLLVLTNDKSLNQRILNPDAKQFKTYLCQVDGAVDGKALWEMERGVEIKHKGKVHFTAPAKAKAFEGDIPEEREPPVRFRQSIPTSWLTLSIAEGKNRQVRKMTAAVGFPTLRLIRVRIGGLSLHNLKAGDIREMTYQEIKQIFN
ncbi:pseudouridine synthase [Arcticibacterium luteifluviistationis]|uniref:Pseudouridine synthase n=2 Tax=Arcticibacterium luteifluviistationis TaxID=1784714 RepID=A0A2Z4GAV9_9BACT|nr:pseudouridine synthase [Arcticibacterium luteifluviistationis]AWV98419.1 pseudouridine synthase [Arcticibacterium luteifluviistationis]